MTNNKIAKWEIVKEACYAASDFYVSKKGTLRDFYTKIESLFEDFEAAMNKENEAEKADDRTTCGK